MNYSVIIKAEGVTQDTPFIFYEEALNNFFNVLSNYKGSDLNMSIFLIENTTNIIKMSSELGVGCVPVLYNNKPLVIDSTKKMINRLSDLMEIRNLTYLQVSQKSGLKISNLSRFFSENSNPTLKTYIAVSNAITEL